MTLSIVRTCPIHGSAEWAVYPRKSKKGGPYQRCLACRRLRERPTHNHGQRCRKRGHLKTPWTWRFYGTQWKCLPCEYIRRVERRREQREQAS